MSGSHEVRALYYRISQSSSYAATFQSDLASVKANGRNIWMKFILPIIGLLLFGCSKNNSDDSAENSGLMIKSGFVCGWGSGTDTLEISKTTIRYVYYIPRQSHQPQISKSRSVSESEWNEIKSSVKMDEFTRLTFNTCNVCFDGCDEWIFIQENESSHKITFGFGTSIYTISKLQAKLTQLRKEFNNQ
jgi:hypothetical protein